MINDYRKKVFGVGITDIYTGGIKRDKSYSLWKDILRRCYSENSVLSLKSYENCEISEDWKTYSNFKRDVEEMVGFDVKGYQIDKDLLGDGSLYSKNTVCFLPNKLNMFLVKHKERRGNLPIGVSLSKNSKYPFRARCKSITGNDIEIGRFSKPEEAFEAYRVYRLSLLSDLIEMYSDCLDPRAISKFKNYDITIDF